MRFLADGVELVLFERGLYPQELVIGLKLYAEPAGLWNGLLVHGGMKKLWVKKGMGVRKDCDLPLRK